MRPVCLIFLLLLAAATAVAQEPLTLRTLLEPIPPPGKLREQQEAEKAPEKGRTAAEVELAQTRLPVEMLEAWVRPILEEHFAVEGDLVIAWLSPASLPPRATRIIDASIASGLPKRLPPVLSLSLQLTLDNSETATLQAVVRLHEEQEVLVALAPVKARAALEADLFETRRVRLRGMEDQYVPADIALENYRSRTSLRPGRTIRWRDIETRPVVQKGTLVDVRAGRGALQITMKARALENGGIGDTIAVQNPDSSRRIFAQIIDENTLQAQF